MTIADAELKALLKELKGRTGDHTARTVITGAALFVAYVLVLALGVALENVALKILVCIILSFQIGQLVVTGHDAGHNSLSRSKALNEWFGLVLFLPSLHPYSLWIHHHNFVHHRYVAQIGKDNAFPPLTPDQYRALPAWKRARYRFYRSLIGQHFWYFFDIHLPRILLPFLDKTRKMTRRDLRDTLIMYTWIAATLGFCFWVSVTAHAGQPFGYHAVNAFLFGLFLPVFFWTTHITFLSIFQHTAPDAKWKLPDGKPSNHDDMIAGTVHVTFPEWLDIVFLRIMQHQAHHLNVHIDLHSVKDAQKVVAEANERKLTRPWTPRYHLNVTRQCKLYDPDKGGWVTFEEVDGAAA
jgi:omega-6 fatty acid desaturase (delta-12 desaturase)